MAWVKEVGELLPNAYDPETTPQVGELDELETFVGQKKTRFGTGCAVDHFKPGILGWVLGDRSTETFQPKRENSGRMGVLFLGHGRMEGLSPIYSRRRPNYLQNLYD